jgi:hypothetical protein
LGGLHHPETDALGRAVVNHDLKGVEAICQDRNPEIERDEDGQPGGSVESHSGVTVNVTRARNPKLWPVGVWGV